MAPGRASHLLELAGLPCWARQVPSKVLKVIHKAASKPLLGAHAPDMLVEVWLHTKHWMGVT
jgi:hypothetical protein